MEMVKLKSIKTTSKIPSKTIPKTSSKALVKVVERVYKRPKKAKKLQPKQPKKLQPKKAKKLPSKKADRICRSLPGGDSSILSKVKAGRVRGNAEKAKTKTRTSKRLKTGLKTSTTAEFKPEKGSGLRALPAVHESTPKSRYMAYIRGFSQGASGQGRAEFDTDFADYLMGYEEGTAARDAASDEYAIVVGYRPDILKVQDL